MLVQHTTGGVLKPQDLTCVEEVYRASLGWRGRDIGGDVVASCPHVTTPGDIVDLEPPPILQHANRELAAAALQNLRDAILVLHET